MVPKGIHEEDDNDYQLGINLIYEIVKAEYGTIPSLLEDLIFDVISLYEGRWGTHEACEVGYHNFSHALDVTLLTARMIAGWNKTARRGAPPLLDKEIFLCGAAAAMFHDTGYIKNKGDHNGQGGKYSFSHEKRSMDLARKYLTMKGWPADSVILVQTIISITEFHSELALDGKFNSETEQIMARMVATADLVAQMADVDYMQRINDLFDEQQEAYKFEGADKLEARGIKIFSSAKEMIDGTIDFYDNFVLPRLQKLGRMDQYLISFFEDGRNPYLENIAANLSANLMDRNIRWRRLGDILEELGLVNSDQINQALEMQKKQQEQATKKDKSSDTSFRERLLEWMEDSKFSNKCLGDILMEMKVISPPILRKGLLHQMLPANMVDKLSRKELLFLLHISLLLQSIGRGPWLFDQILEMTNELLDSEGSSILLANPESQEMLIAIPTGPNKDFLDGRTMPADKGLSGWVFSHGQPAIVSNVSQDDRFDSEVDRNIRFDFETRSVLAVPLHINGELIGVMEVVNKSDDNFTQHDMDILTMLANVIAVSLDSLFRLQELYS